MQKFKAIFRVDAGPKIGLGHLQRSLSLAKALRQLGADCVFLTNENKRAEERIARFDFNCSTIDGTKSFGVNDVRQTLEMASSQNCSAVIVDSDQEGIEYLSELRHAGLYICAIDDLAPHPFPCQMVVNGDANAHQLSYHSTSGDTLFILGTKYSLLGSEFWDISPRMSHDNVRVILITLGGSDPYNLMPRILNSLGQIPGEFKIKAIVGPFFDNFSEVKSAAQCSQRMVELILSPASTYESALEADLAVSAGGQTMYELACVGCPTIAVRIASNQEGQLKIFSETGFARPVGRADDHGIVESIAEATKALMTAHDARIDMTTSGQKLIDGQGALRVAQRLMAEIVSVPYGHTTT